MTEHRVDDDRDDSVSAGNHDFRLVDFGHGGFGLAHGALRMNAATRIDGLMTDRTTETSGNRGVKVFGVHPELSDGRERGDGAASAE